MTNRRAFDGKLYAGKPHVQFDNGEIAAVPTLRREPLLYKKLLLLVFVVIIKLSEAATTCIVGGWPVAGMQTAVTGTVQNIIIGDVFNAQTLLTCQIDTRVRFKAFAPIDVLESRDMGFTLIVR